VDTSRPDHSHYSRNSSVIENDGQDEQPAQTVDLQSPNVASGFDDDEWEEFEKAINEIARLAHRGELKDKPLSEEEIEQMLADLREDRDETSGRSDNSLNTDCPSDKTVNRPDDLPECQKLGASTDNPVSSKRSVSVFRDAKFMRELKVLEGASIPTTRRTTLLVTKTPYSTSLKDKTKSEALTTEESLSALLSHGFDPYKPWWDESWYPQLPPPARQYRSPAPWRDTSDVLRITFRHLALKTIGPVCTINLNLRDDVEGLARGQRYPLGWLHRRIAHHLQEVLNRPVEFHLVLEEVGVHRRRLHVHGELQISAEEAKEARAALRKAGGVFPEEARNFQAQTRPNPDGGWLNYLVGDLWRIGFTRSVLPRIAHEARLTNSAITFQGNAASTTQGVNERAKQIYEQQLRMIKRASKT